MTTAANTSLARSFSRRGTGDPSAEDPSLADLYDETRTQMLTEHQALKTIVDAASEVFAFRQGTDWHDRLMAALHYGSIAFLEYTVDDADVAFGRGRL